MRFLKLFILSGPLLVLTLPSVVAAGDPVARLLPHGSQVLEERPLDSANTLIAVAYRHGHDYLALAQNGATARIAGTRILPGTFMSLRVSRAEDAIETISSGGTGQAEWVCALDGSDNGLSAAVAGRKHGCLFGDEGVRFHSNGFTVRRRDSSHTGSVHYRLLSRYTWTQGALKAAPTRRVPDYAPAALPKPNAVAQTVTGDTILLKLEEARTADEQSTGLMNRRSLDADSGMIFIWPQPVHLSFWMDNTYVPLSVAFLSTDGVIQEIQNMQPLTTTLHTPAESYTYAIEMNLGFFSANGIKVGDRLALHL